VPCASDNRRLDERSFRIAVILIGHIIFLSAGALRILRGQRDHWIRADAPWWIGYATTLIWLPLLVATLVYKAPFAIADELQLLGLGVALMGALFAAWGMWSLGRSYGIKLDLFAGHQLKTDGPYAVVRHPIYFGILVYHLGASVALESAFLLAGTVAYVLPLLLARIAWEERVLRAGFGEQYDRYALRVPPLVPLLR